MAQNIATKTLENISIPSPSRQAVFCVTALCAALIARTEAEKKIYAHLTYGSNKEFPMRRGDRTFPVGVYPPRTLAADGDLNGRAQAKQQAYIELMSSSDRRESGSQSHRRMGGRNENTKSGRTDRRCYCVFSECRCYGTRWRQRTQLGQLALFSEYWIQPFGHQRAWIHAQGRHLRGTSPTVNARRRFQEQLVD